MNICRAACTGFLTMAMLLVTGLPVSASSPQLSAGDLEEYLLKVADADYAGTQLVITVFSGETKAGVVGVAHASSMLMVAESTVVGAGRVKVNNKGSVLFPDWNHLGVSERYDTLRPVSTWHLGRRAESVSVMEGSLLRARIVFDKETGAPLATEVFTDTGAPFRQSWMFQFESTPPRDAYENAHDDAGEYTVMFPVSTEGLPLVLSGYRLADRYSGPDDVYQAFYSDGLFSFSLFELEGNVPLAQFDRPMTVEFGNAKYQVLVTPARMWVRWTVPDKTFVVVGDLPPSHLEGVLSELPRPRKRNFFARVWKGLFG